MLGVVVVGGIYSPQQPDSRWGRLLSMGAPDSPVREASPILWDSNVIQLLVPGG
jgi:hypothetical protein